MTKKVGEGRKCGRTDCDEQRAVGAYLCEKHAQGEGIVEGLVAKWRGEAEALAKIGQPGAEQIAEDYLRECATELEAALAKQTPAPRELTPRECFETYRNLVWTVQEADGMNRGWVEFARRLNEIAKFRPAQQTPHAAGQDALIDALKRKIAEWRERATDHEGAEDLCDFNQAQCAEQYRNQANELEVLASQTSTAPGVARERCMANPTADPPQDCDFPFCGCFAMATKTIEALQECGWAPGAAREGASDGVDD